jgi:hypothetical protein
MVPQRLLPDFVLSSGDGGELPFHDLLADFNILVIRRVPEPSHGTATELLRSLLAENRGTKDVTVSGFDPGDRPVDRTKRNSFDNTCGVRHLAGLRGGFR